MTNLSDFSPEDAERIVSLPYKAAIHVSYAEDEDGEGDDEGENQAIEKCISAIKHSEKVPVLLRQIASDILQRRADWPSWSENVFNIEPACEAAVKAMKNQASEAEVKAYIKMVLDLASDVAQAYGEFGLEPEKPATGFMASIKKLIGGKQDTSNNPMNVSAAEDESIAAIARALRKYA